MRILNVSRFAFSVCAALAMLAGCGGSSSLGGPVPASGIIGESYVSANGIEPGYMKVTFGVAAPLEFSKYKYLVILNTSRSGKTPEGNSWAGYSFALETNRQSGAPSAQVVAFIRGKNRHVPPAQEIVGTTPRQFKFVANSNGAGTEFSILFQRSIFSGFQRGRESRAWLFNAFSIGESKLVDSMGKCGSCFVSPKLPVYRAFDDTIVASTKPKGIDPPAKIVSIEFANNP
jgi:hypothetical protein